jgi:hypothetical protein
MIDGIYKTGEYMAITHTFVSTKSDGGDSSLVKPSDWNGDHTGGVIAQPQLSKFRA